MSKISNINAITCICDLCQHTVCNISPARGLSIKTKKTKDVV